MRISNKLLLVLSSVVLLAGCTESDGGSKPACPDCPECVQCEQCKECEACEKCEECEECEKCEECEECPVPHEHTFADTWSMDESNHWKEATCEHTNLTKDLAEHIDSDKNGVCDVCEYVFEVIPNSYTVIWENYDNKVLEVDYDVLEGTVPEYNGEDPVRIGEEDIYVFSGWSPEVTEISKNEIYVAQYEVDTTTYKVTWEDDIGNILKQEDVQIGHIPSFGDEDPAKPSTEFEQFVFTGWDKEPSRVFEDVTYKATFEPADWCVSKEGFKKALNFPENPNLKVEVTNSYNPSVFVPGIFEFSGDLLREQIPTYGTVYATGNKTYYYSVDFTRWMLAEDLDIYEARKFEAFLYDGADFSKAEIVCDYANKQYILTEESDLGAYITYFKFLNGKIQSMHVDVVQKDPYVKATFVDIFYTWGGCEDIEIPEEVLNDAKYRLLGDDAYNTVFTLLDSQTLTHYDYNTKGTIVISIAKQADGRYLLKLDYGRMVIYYDGFYQYNEINDDETYVRFEKNEPADSIYLNGVLPECIAKGDYTYNKDTCCYEFIDTQYNETHAIQFEFGLPSLIKRIDNATGETIFEIAFSNYNSTTVIIPEHDWN